MRHALIAIVALAILTACGGTPAVTAAQVSDKLSALGATAIHAEPLKTETPVPRSFTDRLVFAVPRIAPKGGQFFICDTKKNCDAIYAYFDALKALAGPYLYQSPSGTVVVQLNSGLTPQEAAPYEAMVKALP